MNKDKGRRSVKTTRAQYQLYLEELQVNRAFRESKFDGANPDIIQNTWSELCTKLNALGGPIKDVVGWKRIFTDWKSQTRAKARKIKCSSKETGNIGDPPKPLTDLEEMLLNITGTVVIDGMVGVPELGTEELPDKTNEATTETELKPNVMNNFGCGSAKPKITNENICPPKKKLKTFVGCVKEMIEKKKPKEMVLNNIALELKKLRKLEEQKLKLRKMILQVKYPEYTFVLDSSDSE